MNKQSFSTNETKVSSSNKKILVTGGTGFIGSALVKELVKSGETVRILDNDSRGSIERLEEIRDKFEFIKGDIRDTKMVEKACRGMDSVIHLAYINGTEFFYSIPEIVLEVGVKGMINTIDACIKNKVKELIVLSSSEVYNNPPMIPTPEKIPLIIPDTSNPRFSYAGGKIISELMTLYYGKKYFKRAMIVRPHNVYGPNMGMEHVIAQFIIRMGKLRKKSNNFIFPLQGTGSETRSFIYIDDFTDALMVLLKKGKHLETYNIGTMNEVSIEHIASLIAELLSVTIKIRPGKLLAGSPIRRCPDTRKIQKLGFKPKITLYEGLKSSVDWYLSNTIT